MTSKHLGNTLHDLLDGRLSGEKAYAAMAHLGACEDCATRYHELRATREALSTAEAGIDMTFAQRLLDKERIAQIAAHEPPSKARATQPRTHRPALLMGAVGVAATGVVAVAWTLGAPAQVGLEFAPSDASVARPVAYMGAQGMRSGDQLASWIHPDFDKSGIVPVEAQVMERYDGTKVLVATMLLNMNVVVVTEEHGTLAPEVTELPLAEVAGMDLYVLSSANPARVAWQTGDVVIALGCECDLAVLTAVASEFPSVEGPGFVDRVGDGLQELADLLP